MDARKSLRASALLLAAVLLGGCASAPEQPAEDGSRTMNREEADALLLGKGMGMAAAAEINGYPGPRHVLELKDELELTPDQRFATSRLVGVTQGQARGLGQRIVNAERQLDEAMARGDITSAEMRGLVQGIAALRGQLRFVHMNAHLEQKKILTAEQVRRYYELRGRDVVLAPPKAPPPVTAPLTLPADAPAMAEPAPTTISPAPAAAPATSSMPEAASTTPMEEAATEEVAPLAIEPEETVDPTPANDAVAAPMQPQALTPGTRDAMEEATSVDAQPLPLPASSDESVPPALPLPTEAPANAEPPPDAEPAGALPLSPGAQDALELSQPADDTEDSTVIEVNPLDDDTAP